MDSLGERIVHLRKMRYMTQKDLAEASGLSIPTIKAVENGRTELRSDSAIKIAEALNVSPNFLMTGNGNEGSDNDPSQRSRTLGASFLSLRRMSMEQLQAAEEMLRVIADMDDDEFQNYNGTKKGK